MSVGLFDLYPPPEINPPFPTGLPGILSYDFAVAPPPLDIGQSINRWLINNKKLVYLFAATVVGLTLIKGR
jgi:hypothetical protein